MHWRHEQLSLGMPLAAATHHSFDKVHAEHAAPRSQRTGTRCGVGEVFEFRTHLTQGSGRSLWRKCPSRRWGSRGTRGSATSWCSTSWCRRRRNSWWKSLTFQFLVVGVPFLLKVFKVHAQYKVLMCLRCKRLLWSTSHPRLQCFVRQRQWSSLLHPRQQFFFACASDGIYCICASSVFHPIQWWSLLLPRQQ